MDLDRDSAGGEAVEHRETCRAEGLSCKRRHDQAAMADQDGKSKWGFVEPSVEALMAHSVCVSRIIREVGAYADLMRSSYVLEAY